MLLAHRRDPAPPPRRRPRVGTLRPHPRFLKAPRTKEGGGALHEPVNVGAEMSEERPLAVRALPEQEGMMVSLLQLWLKLG